MDAPSLNSKILNRERSMEGVGISTIYLQIETIIHSEQNYDVAER